MGLGTEAVVPVGSTGRVLRRRSLEDGSVVTWGRVLKPLMVITSECWRHVERVANFLMDLLGEGSAGTVMKYMMGLLQGAPSSRGKGFGRI